ncbi:unnamed protein product, partial [Chrysoparadoxa australica]
SFENARFVKNAPLFAETTLHEATTWHNVQWPITPTVLKDALRMADAYAHLRRRANSIQNHEAELDFFAREMRAKRRSEGIGKWLLVTLFEISSNFGRSVSLPLLWMIGLSIYMVPIYDKLIRYAGREPASDMDLLGLSAASLGGFFGIRREFISPELLDSLPYFAVILSNLQSVAGAILVFLIGLALRNRFRIK